MNVQVFNKNPNQKLFSLAVEDPFWDLGMDYPSTQYTVN